MLLNSLGYRSDRTLRIGAIEDFVKLVNCGLRDSELTQRQLERFKFWNSVDIVFQFTAEEISASQELPGLNATDFEQGRAESFLFLAVDLKTNGYTRSLLADMTRIVNRGFPMPVIVLYRHEDALSLAAVHRRAHKRDTDRDVLEEVTLVKDIRCENPHRAQVDALADLALPHMIEKGVQNFDTLHREWERVFDIEVLNRRFYGELFAWFEWAIKECRFPDDGAGEGSQERHVIRLITRLLFIWFMNEKGLIPRELFDETFARKALRDYAPGGSDYYRAILQNLFFATLNTEIHQRAFSEKSNTAHRDFAKYRFRNLLADPDKFVNLLKAVPFVNGGLFDCLDDFAGIKKSGPNIDVFTDNVRQHRCLDIPAHLFFDQNHGLFALFSRYKFTVEENTPIDVEVALDPELLGRAFENLLAAYNPETRNTARKATGSYYTPRKVVEYMVREALTEALAAKTTPNDGDSDFWRERLRYLLDHSDAMDDAEELFAGSEKKSILSAIADLRILDPAVGSGAFPMGVLQTLTLALRRLDPHNELWEEFQKDRAKNRAGEAFEAQDRERRDQTLREISDTFERYGRQSDYGRKLYLIQNGIFGVDVQPIACQIAKLRFFISLVIEQATDTAVPNLGIKPLPNLETRFVVADSLIGLHSEADAGLLVDDVGKKRKEIEALRERYFLTDNRVEKLRCIDMERRSRKELQQIIADERRIWLHDQEKNIEGKAAQFPRVSDGKAYIKKKWLELQPLKRKFDEALDDARKFSEWDPYNQNAHADWFSPEHMFGVADGFDVVIGNPPYIQLQKNSGRLAKRYAKADYETFVRTGDIYQLFFERGCRLLRPTTGILAYITSNSWLKAAYGKPLREWLAANYRPLRLIEMGKDVFNAIVDTAVLLVNQGTAENSLPAVDVEEIKNDQFPPPQKHWVEARPKGNAPWCILSSPEWRILHKMREIGTPLRDWDIRINYGIKTGYNAAFIIDDAKRNELLAQDPRSDEIIKPILRGCDIRRYRARWAGQWLIATFPPLGLDIATYPAIERHLRGFGKSRLEQLGKKLPNGGRARKKTSNRWFELQDSCAYHEDFRKEKLFWMHMSPVARWACPASVDGSGLGT